MGALLCCCAPGCCALALGCAADPTGVYPSSRVSADPTCGGLAVLEEGSCGYPCGGRKYPRFLQMQISAMECLRWLVEGPVDAFADTFADTHEDASFLFAHVLPSLDLKHGVFLRIPALCYTHYMVESTALVGEKRR